MSSLKKNRLTPFEEYMFWDESPAFPMRSFQTLRFSGPFDRSVFEEAFYDALGRHPLMNSRIIQRGRKVYWEPLETLPEIRTARGLAEDDYPALTPPNIREASGLLTVYKECAKSEGNDCRNVTEIGFLIHHSVSDADGILAFLEDILIGYAIKKGRVLPTTAFRPIAEESMALRHDLGMTWKRYWRLLPRSLKSTGRLVFHQPEPLLPLRKADRKTLPERYPLYRRFALSQEETAAYRRKAKSHGVTMNDLLLRDHFLASADFKSRYSPESNRWIRVAMPINMRLRDFPNLFAANIVSMVFLDRRVSHVSEKDDFLKGIHRETDWIKRTDQGLALLENLKGRRNLPGGIQMELRNNRCWATTVLSNLGILFAKTPLPRTDDGKLIVGDAVLEDFCGMPPLRAKTFTSWGVWSYAGHLKFAVHYDDRYLTPEQAEQTFSLFKNRILDSAAESEYNKEETFRRTFPSFPGDCFQAPSGVISNSPIIR